MISMTVITKKVSLNDVSSTALASFDRRVLSMTLFHVVWQLFGITLFAHSLSQSYCTYPSVVVACLVTEVLLLLLLLFCASSSSSRNRRTDKSLRRKKLAIHPVV